MSGAFSSEFPLPPAYYRHISASDDQLVSFTPPPIPNDFKIEMIYSGSVLDAPPSYNEEFDYKEALTGWVFTSTIFNLQIHSSLTLLMCRLITELHLLHIQNIDANARNKEHLFGLISEKLTKIHRLLDEFREHQVTAPYSS
jgi:hypothetical protein